MTIPPEIALPERLKSLVQYCEKTCVADCCGICAFDFSPLHVASCISAFTGVVTESAIAEWDQELAKAAALVADFEPNESGLICSVAGMNQYFSRESYDEMLSELRHSVHAAPKMIECSMALAYPKPPNSLPLS